MKSHRELTYLSRIRYLRQVAQAALPLYRLGDARLTLLSHRGNAMFRVDAPSSSRFVLRVYRPGGPSTLTINSELAWLAAIRQDTDLVVPQPVANEDGSLLSEVRTAGSPEAWRCVLFRWVEGRFIDAGLTPARLGRVGQFMARLHGHSELYVPPPGFTRPRQDWTRLFGTSSVFAKHDDSIFSNNERAIFSAAAEKIRAELQTLKQGPSSYGLIHADLQQTNYLFRKGEVRAIDFEDCAWGHFTFDMAITLFEVADRPNGQAMRDAFLAGYQSIRPLPPQYEKEIGLFTAVRLMKRVNYLLSSDNTALRAQAPKWVDYSARWLSTFLR